jgi:Inner membrane protein YgaP-like, transmembrane domain
MKKNMGAADKSIRLLVVIVIAILYFTNVISGTLAIILGIIAVAFVITSLFSFCPAYVPLKMNTAKKETK